MSDYPAPPFDMTMNFGPGGTYSFVEDENCNITGYGHQDKAEFAAAINRYDAAMNGEPLHPEEQWGARDITHKWAVATEQNGEPYATAKGVTRETPGAFPITCLWGAR